MSAYSDLVLADNPLGYWRLGEASGTVATDETATTDGTYVNTPTLGEDSLIATDPADTSVLFTAAQNEYVSIGAVAGATSVTGCEFWVKNPVDWDDATSAMVAVQLRAGFYGILFGASTSAFANEILTVVGTSGNWIEAWNSPTDVLAAGIHHIFFNFNGSNWDIYVDGVQKRNASTGTPAAFDSSAMNSVQIARRSGDTNFAFGGTLDEVAIYGSALTEARIMEHHEIGLSIIEDNRMTGGAIRKPPRVNHSR